MVSLEQAIFENAGIYTIQEAALYSRLHQQTLKRWLIGDSRTKSVTDREGLVNDGEYVGFLDFVQALAIHAIRKDYRISLQKIRDAVKCAQDEYGLSYPLAKKHSTYIQGGKIYIVPDGEENPILLTGKSKGQYEIRKILEVYLQDVSWDGAKLASAYRPFGMGILMNPKKNFGEPIVEKCGLPAIDLRDAVETEGSFEEAAQVFGVSEADVITAVRFFDLVEGRPAA